MSKYSYWVERQSVEVTKKSTFGGKGDENSLKFSLRVVNDRPLIFETLG